jgi:hypothetical protein
MVADKALPMDEGWRLLRHFELGAGDKTCPSARKVPPALVAMTCYGQAVDVT